MNRGTRRRLWTWVPIFVVFGVVWVVLSLPSVQEHLQAYLIVRSVPPLQETAPPEEPPLPESMAFHLMDGNVVTGESLRGTPAVISVFTTGCPPCVAEVAMLERLRSSVGQDAKVLLVALDKPQTLNNWLEGRDSDRAAFATVDRILPPLTTKAIPMTVLLDAQGNVNRKLTGAWKWDDPSVVEHIKALAR